MPWSLEWVIPLIILVALAILFIFFGLVAQKRKITTGQEGMVGKTGIAQTEITPQGGKVFVAGELWESASKEKISSGNRVIVREVQDLLLIVDALKSKSVID
jgi:membrane-bound serine protease (ClpP class)